MEDILIGLIVEFYELGKVHLNLVEMYINLDIGQTTQVLNSSVQHFSTAWYYALWWSIISIVVIKQYIINGSS